MGNTDLSQWSYKSISMKTMIQVWRKNLKVWDYSFIYELSSKNFHRYAAAKGKGTSNSTSHKEIVSVATVISLLDNMSYFRVRYVSSVCM